MNRVNPNFFILGAPKCGTTALYAYLAEHPQVCVPHTVKEPHFFASDMPGKQIYCGIDDYQTLFQHAKDQDVAIGEGSVFYLYSDAALANIQSFNPKARLIAMLRNPVDAAYSYHQQALYSRNEDELDFEAAWRLQEARARGEHIPPTCQAPQVLQYRALFSYASQLERMFSLFPREQCLIILFDDFARDTQYVYARTLDFLGLKDDKRTEFPRVNEAKTHRFGCLGTLILAPPSWLRTPIVNACRAAGFDYLRPLSHLQRWNTRKFVRASLSPTFRRELEDSFSTDLQEVGKLLGREIPASWLGDNVRQANVANTHPIEE